MVMIPSTVQMGEWQQPKNLRTKINSKQDKSNQITEIQSNVLSVLQMSIKPGWD